MKQKLLAVIAAASAAVVSGQAAASAATDAMTSIGTEATAMIDAAWPIVVAVVVAGVGIKLFKKFANKSS